MPPELAAQMPLLKELLQDLGYRIVTCEGWEADDILGTFARACEEKGDTCMIATGDRDSLQLVSPQTTVRLATTKFGQSAVTVYDEAKIREDYGVSPKQLIDIKAIQGDTSDNIPGVAGIGEKGAGELIRKFGSLQYIYDNLETLDIKPGMRAKLEASRDNAFLSYDLGTIRRNAPIDTALADYVPTAGDPAAAAALMTRLELFKLMERLHITPGAAVQKAETGEAAEALPVHEYAYGEQLAAEAERLRQEIFEDVGYAFNVNSPAQLGEALFVKLGLPHGKKTKTGWSTNADVLEGLRDVHPAVDKVLRYRTLSKLKSTYCDGLLKVIAADGRIHSNFNQTETRTGRISSTEPNLQNIPVRTAIGREFRRFFIAPEGHKLVDADYSQIELRVLAHVANDAQMIDDFKSGRDIHTSTAARVFDMPEELVTPQMRSRAKAVNFGIVYGIGAFSLAKDIGVTRREAEDYIHDYLKNYRGVAEYMERVVEEAKKNGYVETLFGRRRYLPELASSNFNMRAFGERVARNMPIQGAAADIIKIAMIRVRDRLLAEKLEARLILQVHDELIVECPDAETARVEKILAEEMENAVSLSVPMIADAKSGQSWYAAKG